jgi:hypothetical protein
MRITRTDRAQATALVSEPVRPACCDAAKSRIGVSMAWTVSGRRLFSVSVDPAPGGGFCARAWRAGASPGSGQSAQPVGLLRRSVSSASAARPERAMILPDISIEPEELNRRRVTHWRTPALDPGRSAQAGKRNVLAFSRAVRPVSAYAGRSSGGRAAADERHRCISFAGGSGEVLPPQEIRLT